MLWIVRSAPAYWNFPPAPPPEEYGNLLIDRISKKNKVSPVTFSHWSHRVHYTCRVCHFELEFAMKVNTTEITEEQNRAGKFCGACHNEKIAFGHERNHCDKCHNGDITFGGEKFAKLADLPATKYGNKIDWVKAFSLGLIKPKKFLVEESGQMPFDKDIELKAWQWIPQAIFPHRAHTPWLDCANCHPDIFNIKQKSTENFSMTKSLEGKFCGVCHLRIAMPFNDCERCHPSMAR